MIWIILKVLLFTAILKLAISYSTSHIFFKLRRPQLWVLFMFLISFIFFFVGSVIQDSFNAVWWSVVLTLIIVLPITRKRSKEEQEYVSNSIDELYRDAGVEGGRQLYKVGIAAFAVGGVIGWIVFYGQIIIA